MPTLADVATLAGCSVSVASRVLKNKDNSEDRIADATRDRVRKAAEKLGYRPNRMAEFLKYGRIPEIGVFLPDYNNSLILDLVRGCSESAKSLGFSLSFFFNQEVGSFNRFLNDNIGQKNCGIITCAPELINDTQSVKLISSYCQSGGYLVLVDDNSNKLNLNFTNSVSRIVVNDRLGGVLVAKHLLSCNVNKFFLQAPTRPRSLGFVEELKSVGKEVTWLPKTEQGTDELFDMLMQEKDSCGVFCGSDRLALKLYSKLARNGELVGNKIKLVGYDDTYNSDVLSPALTSVKQPFFESGVLAVKNLVDMIYKRPIQEVFLDPVLIKRETA